MNLQQLTQYDLNLLVAFKALDEERNVTRAAERIGISQPAMSRTLQRLRHQFNDELFIRAPNGLALTHRAEQIRQQLGFLLSELSGLLSKQAFDATTAEQTFHIVISDYGASSLMPAILNRLYREAPNVNIVISPWHEHTLQEMQADQIDLALGVAKNPPANIHGRVIGHEKLLCISRHDHPAQQDGLSLDSYCQYPHALVTMGGDKRGAVDIALEKLGRKRRIALRVPHFMAALHIIKKTDLLLTVPGGLLQNCLSGEEIVIASPPVELASFPYSVLWHGRSQNDEAHRWLRTLFYEEGEKAISSRPFPSLPQY